MWMAGIAKLPLLCTVTLCKHLTLLHQGMPQRQLLHQGAEHITAHHSTMQCFTARSMLLAWSETRPAPDWETKCKP